MGSSELSWSERDFSRKTSCWQYRAGTNGSEDKSTEQSVVTRGGFSLRRTSPFVQQLLQESSLGRLFLLKSCGNMNLDTQDTKRTLGFKFSSYVSIPGFPQLISIIKY